MPTVNLSPLFNGYQGFTAGGLPLSGGLINTYQAGTSTPVATYTTNIGDVANSNPIQLGPDGRPPQEVWLIQGQAYRFVLTDSLGLNPITYDNIAGVNDGTSLVNFITTLATSAGAALVGWIQAGIGAITRTVSSKLREKVSVLDFGADPTGVASSDTAFANAIAATTFDGVVEVPDPGSAGFYKLTAGLTIAAVTGSARLVGIGRPTLKFTGLGAAVDGITITGANYRQSQLENLIIDMSLSGRDGVVLMAGSQPIQKNVTVQNTLRDAFSYQCAGFNWIEKLQRSHCTGISIGRHFTYAMTSGANGAFMNETFDVHPEVRGCAQKVTGGTAIVADSQGTSVGGSQISGWHIIDPVFDCIRSVSVANGFDVGVNPILCKYNAAAAYGGQYDSWKIIGGGLETTTGTPVPGVGLVKVEQNASAYGWTIDLGNPGGWPTGGGYVGLRDAQIHDRQTGMVVTRDTGARAGLKTYVAGVGGPYTVDIPFPILPGFGAAFMNSGSPSTVSGTNNDNGALAMPSQFYSLMIAYNRFTGSDFCYYRSEFAIFYNLDNANGWGVGANNVVVNSLGGFITVNSVTIDPANNRVRLSISTTATYGTGGGNLRTTFGLSAIALARDTL